MLFNRKKDKQQAAGSKKTVISAALKKNIDMLDGLFSNDETFKMRCFENRADGSVKCCIFFIDGMVDGALLSECVITPVMTLDFGEDKVDIDDLKTRFITADEVRNTKSLTELAVAIQNGDTALLMDGSREGLIISSKGWKSRNITEPEIEKVIRGPRQGFNESLVTNLSMLRRNVRTNRLKIKFMRLGTVAQNELCICYLEGIANERLVREAEKRVGDIKINAVLDSNYVSELIRDEPLSPFKTIGTTERPDIVASYLLEGRISIIVDGSPVALVMPYLFADNFEMNDDYYVNYYFAGISRLIRIIAFFFTISIPSIYLGFVTFHQEMLPTSLVISLYSSRMAVPFPTVIEMLSLLVAFELLREAGAKTPSGIGQAVSILGAVVIGQSAVEAKLISAPLVIIVALVAITGIANLKMKGAIIVIRLLLILLTTMLGLHGLVMGALCLCLHLASMRSFGVSFLSKAKGNSLKEIGETAIRAPLWLLKRRKPFFANKNVFKEDIDEK